MKKYITIVVMVLTIIVGITAYLNMKTVAVKKDLEENALFVIKENGKEIAAIDMKTIKSLGESKFEAKLKKSGEDPTPYTYTGVLLKKIFENYEVELKNKSAVVVKAIDGYTVAVDIEKVLADDNVYLTYMREGEGLGNKEDGGSGPYQMIISKDPFSQYWCKFALEADAQ
ncbi:hypothetical protein QBE52_14945 [Clostridiaceae bacterium 35-E11]